jgi:3-phenylpropionate/trans-cinnamate dioxygenase ferredoxin reductase component
VGAGRPPRATGVELHCSTSIVELTGSGRVERARLSDGSALPTDLVVVSIGCAPAITWLEGSGLRTGDGVVCDEVGRTSDPHSMRTREY